MNTAAGLVAVARAAGITFAVVPPDSLRVEFEADPPAGLIADLKDHKAAILAHLADRAEAVAILTAFDDRVAAQGNIGRRPDVAELAGRLAATYERDDLAGLRTLAAEAGKALDSG